MANPISSAEKDWRAENDLNTLIEAEKIKRDKKRLAAAMKKKREMKQDLQNVGESANG